MTDEPYDSRPDTLAHIGEVRKLLLEVIEDLSHRALVHDASKLAEPELSVFDKYTPLLQVHAYGSPEYQADLEGMGVGLRAHYAANDHHPEFHSRGVADMDLVQIIEMLADWKAATLRHPDGDLIRSIALNAKRFQYGEDFARLLLNTAERFGWIDAPEPTRRSEDHA